LLAATLLLALLLSLLTLLPPRLAALLAALLSPLLSSATSALVGRDLPLAALLSGRSATFAAFTTILSTLRTTPATF
jgi:hypothetical protein